MTATLDKTSDSWFHDFVLETFGLTPFVNTFPDFMAGGAVMITALFIAAGMEVSQTTTATKVSFSSCQRNLIKTFQIEAMIALITKMAMIFS